MNQSLQRVLGVVQVLLKALEGLVDVMDLVDKAGKEQEAPVNGPVPGLVSSPALQMGPLGAGFPPSACSDSPGSPMFLAGAERTRPPGSRRERR